MSRVQSQSGIVAALASIPATTTAPLGAELGTGSGLSQTVTTVVGLSYQTGGTGVTGITLDGSALVVASGYSSFVAVGTSSVLVGTGGTDLSVKRITGTTVADVTLAGMSVRRYGSPLFSAGIGTGSQQALTTGSYDNAFGYDSQLSLTTGSCDNAFGHSSQYSLTTGSYDNAFGYDSQLSLTTGSCDNAFGYASQYSLTTGSCDNAFGYASQLSLTTGSCDNAFGHSSQYSLTTGSYDNAFGHSSQYSLTTGSCDNAFGYDSQTAPKGLWANATTTASYQTAMGHESGQFAADTGDKGVAVGYRAVYHTGAVALGSDSEAQGTDSIAIGRAAVATAANSIQIGATGTAYTLSFGSAGRVIGLVELKSIVAAASDFAAFKTAIAALS